MQIGFDAKRYFHNHTGLGNYSRNIVGGLQIAFPDLNCKLYDEKAINRTFGMGRMAEKEGCEVFHGLSNELPFDIKKTGMRSFVTIHDVCWRQFPDMYHAADRLIYDLKYGWAARHADHVIAISESTKRDIQQFYNVPDERITVVYQPVHSRYYSPCTAEYTMPELQKKEFLLYVGSINSRKNLLRILQAMTMIPAENRMPLLVVGNGREYMHRCQDYATRNLRQNDVIWLNNLRDDDQLQMLYAQAKALIYPSLYEGFGLPVVEALLQGCPVLTSNVASLPEAAGPGGLLIDPTSVDDIHSALVRLTDDKNLRQTLADKGKAYCQQMFNPETLSRQLMELYKTR